MTAKTIIFLTIIFCYTLVAINIMQGDEKGAAVMAFPLIFNTILFFKL